MTTTRIHGTFTAHSARIASLTITQSGEFGLTVDPVQQHHQLGFRAAPLFQLAQPLSPDDAWAITTNPSGRLVDAAALLHGDEAERYAAWARGSRATQGHALLGQLPAGSYLLVRSPRPPLALARIPLGNELVEARPNTLVLREHEPVYALVVGPQPSAPRLDQPLLGVIVLNYVGEAWMHGALLFPVAEPSAADPGEGQDLLLIVPVEGELVFDNMGFFSAEDEQRARARWRDELAWPFARWCAGEDA